MRRSCCAARFAASALFLCRCSLGFGGSFRLGSGLGRRLCSCFGGRWLRGSFRLGSGFCCWLGGRFCSGFLRSLRGRLGRSLCWSSLRRSSFGSRCFGSRRLGCSSFCGRGFRSRCLGLGSGCFGRCGFGRCSSLGLGRGLCRRFCSSRFRRCSFGSFCFLGGRFFGCRFLCHSYFLRLDYLALVEGTFWPANSLSGWPNSVLSGA